MLISIIVTQEPSIDWTAWIQAICAIIAVLITFFGTLYIVKSFREQQKINRQQKKTNEQQSEINRLSLEKNRREIRPNFHVNYVLKTVEEKDVLSYSIILTNAIALDVQIYFSTSNRKVELLVDEIKALEPSINIVRETTINNLDFNNMEVEILNKIIFKDEDGREYSQFIKRKSWDVFITFPELKK